MIREIEPHYDPTIGAKVHNLRIDPEFRDFLGSLSDEDKLALSDSIANEGCRDALVAWPQPDGSAILLDGHHRQSICGKFGFAYRVVECPDYITDRESAITWIVNNQRARRNIHPNRVMYLRGKVYLSAKAGHGGDRKSSNAKSSGNDCHLIEENQSAAERIAEDFMVNEKTIRNNAKYAEQVDAIAAEFGPEAREDILDGRKNVSDFTPTKFETPVRNVTSESAPTIEDESLVGSVSPDDGTPELSQPPIAEHVQEAKTEILAGRKKVSDYKPRTRPSVDGAPPPEPASITEAAVLSSSTSTRDPTLEERNLARIRVLSDGECTLEMTRNAVILPGQDCGATAKPVPIPENASPNFADPEVLKRDGDPFCFAVTEMERHALAAETALTLRPPPDNMLSVLIQRLAALETAIRQLSGSLHTKE